MSSCIKLIFAFTLLIAQSTFAEMAVPVQLRLKSPSGTYPTEAGITVKLLVLSPATGCVLREENFSAQTINNGNLSLGLGAGVRGVLDPSLSLNQVYDNSKSKTGLSCIDANNNIVSTGQTYAPAAGDQRIIRVVTTVLADPIIVNFNMRATPYAIQAESVGGKSASDLVSNDAGSQMNQTNLIDLLQDVTRFNNLKSIAVSGQAASAVNFTGNLAGDVSGTQGAVSVDKIKGIAVSGTAPANGQILQFNGAQYVPVNPPSGAVTSVAGRTGAVALSNSDISGLGGAAVLNVGTAAGTVAAGNDSRITGAVQVAAVPTCAAGEYLSFNGTVWSCNVDQNPVAAVSSVAGRTGAVTLNSSDISGLGGAALLNVGSAAGTVAAGNDSRLADVTNATSANTASTIVKRDGSGNFSAGTVSATNSSVQNVFIYDAGNANSVRIKAPGAFSNYILTLPVDDGASGQILRTDGAGGLSWVNAGGGGSVNSVTATAPLVSSGGVNPDISLAQANAAVDGYLTAADWNAFASKQSALGFTPLNPASNLSDVASVATARTNLGLGGAAQLNIGTAAGTVAAGDDARIIGALSNAAFNAYVASASCSSLQTMYWNSVSSTFACQNIPAASGAAAGYLSAADYSSFAAKQNALGYVPLDPSNNLSDIGSVVTTRTNLGLGGAATLNVGIIAGTVAAGNDSRITGAVQVTTIPSCAAGEYLSFNGTVWSCNVDQNSAPPVTSVAGRTGAVVLSNTDISGLGGAAVLNVGTTAATVAAGNDSRITGAVQVAAVPSCAVNQYLSYNGTVWSCNADQDTVLGAATSTTSGYLTAADWVTFNAKQNALGYTPLNAASNLSDVANPATARANLSLGGASTLNVGTAAGTVAAGDDSRMVNAVQTSTAHSGDVSGTVSALVVNKIKGVPVSATAPVNGDVLQYNGTQYVPAAIPSAPVSSVAGRTGAVVLSSSDISGLGGAAVLNIGTVAGTVAAGDDTRIVNALQPSSNASGDVTGNYSANVVTRIRGVLVSPTAPVAGEVLQFNGTQYVPVANPAAPVSSVAGRTGAVTLSNADIAGLGGAALLNVGTVASTVAAGNDSRITGALQNSTFNGYVASASCTTSQSMYWNSVSSQFLCQAISFPADAVTSVAGRTGAVALVSSDISGLGTAAVLNVGTAASNVVQLDGTARIAASTLPTVALTTSSAMSGDISGTSSTLVIDKLKGRTISSTAPTTGQALIYDGTQWIPTSVAAYVRKTADQTFSTTAVVSATQMVFTVANGVTYKFKFNIAYTSAATTTGLRVGLLFPTVTMSTALANIAANTDGTGAYFQGVINATGDFVTATATPTATPNVQYASIEGVIVPSAAGTVQLTIGTEVGGSNVVVKAGSFVEYVIIP